MKKFLFVIGIVLLTSQLFAQNSENQNSIGVRFGLQNYFGEIGNGLYILEPSYGVGGLSYGRYLSEYLDFSVDGNYGEIGFVGSRADKYFRGALTDVNIALRVKIISDEKYSIVPYFTAGLGIASISKYSVVSKTTWISPSLAIGLKCHITKNLDFILQENAVVYQMAALANNYSDHNAIALQHTIGLAFNFGGGKVKSAPSDAVTNNKPVVTDKAKDILKRAIKGVQFESGSDVITKDSYSILDEVVSVMKDNGSYNLSINGHTDNTGKADANLTLSQKRADAVKKYLTDKGIAASRLKATGFGQTKPIVDNSTPEGRAQNRRVEFVIE